MVGSGFRPCNNLIMPFTAICISFILRCVLGQTLSMQTVALYLCYIQYVCNER